MSAYPSCKHGHNDPNFPCNACESEDDLTRLSALNRELVEALGSCQRFICHANYDLDPHYAGQKERALNETRAVLAKAKGEQ